MKDISIVIPAFKAHSTIRTTLASIQSQTMKDRITVIIVNDNPGDSYEEVKSSYPELDIVIENTERNSGPGVARQVGLDKSDSKWITFIDADDVFYSVTAIEALARGVVENCVEVQGAFLQSIVVNGMTQLAPRNDPGHPWVFGRLYNVEFLKQSKIRFPTFRAMEDGCFNWKVRLLIENSPFSINIINEPIYIWKEGSDHSITRIGVKDNIPQYNFDLCQIGATQAAIEAISFAKENNPFNGNIMKFCVEIMISQYFTYVECLGRRKEFAEQNLWLAKKFYHECYKQIESQITEKVLSEMYTMQMAGKAQDLIGIIPEITFNDFFEKVKTEDYSPEQIKEIRSKLDKEIIDNDIKCGVLSESGDLNQ